MTDAAGVADASTDGQPATEQILRITATAVGSGATRASVTVVASANFQNAVPQVNILLRERDAPAAAGMMVDAKVR